MNQSLSTSPVKCHDENKKPIQAMHFRQDNELFTRHFRTIQEPNETIEQHHRRFFLEELTTRPGFEQFTAHCAQLLDWNDDKYQALQEHEFVTIIKWWYPPLNEVQALDVFDAVDVDVQGEITLDQVYCVCCVLLSQQLSCALECLHQMGSFLYANLFGHGTRCHNLPLFLPHLMQSPSQEKLAHRLLYSNNGASRLALGHNQASPRVISEEQFFLICYQLMRSNPCNMQE